MDFRFAPDRQRTQRGNSEGTARWKCRSDGKRGRQDDKGLLPPPLSHSPWKSLSALISHIPTARRLRVILTFLFGAHLECHGCPTAFYSDKHTVFRVNKPDAKGDSGMTQFGRALAELNIEILCANSGQAKGRVERANRTLQDRLAKELRLEEVCDMEAGNTFLPGFVQRFNERFALTAAKPENLHRSLNVQANRLTDILCDREQRHVSEQLTLSYDRKQIILERSELSENLTGQYVEVYDFPDRAMEVRWKGHSLPYRVFSKDQRVSHTAIVGNKRLGHVLSIIKSQQDLRSAPKVMTNSEKIGYKNDRRRSMGRLTPLPDSQPMSPLSKAAALLIAPWAPVQAIVGGLSYRYQGMLITIMR
ncbi:hypothetical protein BDD14_1319 [Edaphobacter modestus]|uniref:Integrase catalytic domain-containing protein n=1 Tax=Edaphobacter modestus TaxID=388466 RepID=A0A4Q7YQF1_9BACT|nr:hypothetical protein BDD14_1319 [Edaphobacter modestus]